MTFTHNRGLVTGVLLLFVAIIALGRSSVAVQTAASNVVVTNTSSQAVPVKVFNTATIPVNVNVSTHGKDGIQRSVQYLQAVNESTSNIGMDAIPGERFVITSISASSFSHTPGDNLTGVNLGLADIHRNYFDQIVIPMSPLSSGQDEYSSANTPILLYLDPGQHLNIYIFRSNATDTANLTIHLSGYRVAYP